MGRRGREKGPKATRFEIATTAFDANLQLIGSDPFRGAYSVGLAIPPESTPDPTHRYLLSLVYARFGPGERVKLVGMRQKVDIGVLVPQDTGGFFPLHREVMASSWAFPDGNVAWYLRLLGDMRQRNTNKFDSDSLAFRYARGPALLFETLGPPYVPPGAGQPPGTPLVPGLDNFTDLRFHWRSDSAWSSLNVSLEGPVDIALYASVRQTNPATRPILPPTTVGTGVEREDAFVSNNPGAVYTRVAGSLIFEIEGGRRC